MTNKTNTIAASLINKAFLSASKPAKKYLAIIESGEIEESQIISMKSFMGKNKENAGSIFEALQDKELNISAQQTRKGLDFLLNQWKTPTGKERTQNPFGYREQNILENFSHFTLSGFYNAGNAYHDFYLPLYTVYSKSGNSFEYYYNGKVNVIG